METLSSTRTCIYILGNINTKTVVPLLKIIFSPRFAAHPEDDIFLVFIIKANA